jgi:amino acid transporter
MIVLVTAIYTTVQLVAIGTIDNLGASPTPLADAARAWMGPIGGFLLTLGAALSVLGTNNNTILSGPRYLYALAEARALPAVFARVHPKYRTPHVAILTQSGLAAALMLTGTAEQLAELSVIARLASYIGTAAAVPVLRRKMPSTERTLRLPGGPLIPLAALAICLLFLFSATAKNLVAGAVALAAGAVIFLSRRGAVRPPDSASS